MIVVAGGTGLLGTRVVRHLVDSGNQVRVLTRHPDRAAHLPPQVEVVVGDVRTGPLDTVIKDCTTVVSATHGFAGPTRTSPSQVDHHGNKRLIAAAQQAGAARFVLVSVVGAAVDHPMSLHRMKFKAEQELQNSGLDGIVVRATSYFETWCDIIAGKVATGGPALVLGPGHNPINFVSADDVAGFVVAAATGDSRVDPLISVGGPQNLTFTQVAEQILAVSGRSTRIRHIPLQVLRAMSILARPVNAEAARKAQAAVVMNTTDMTFDARGSRERFPDIPTTSLADVLLSTGSAA